MKGMKGMSRVIAVLLLAVLAAGMLGGCSKGGNASHVSKSIGQSQLYSEGEIDAAMDIAIKQFRQGFMACTLLTMSYDEEKTMDAAAEWAENYEADEGIVLYSDFEVDNSGRNPSLNPGDTYTDWQWILVRDKGEKWRLVTWGYG